MATLSHPLLVERLRSAGFQDQCLGSVLTVMRTAATEPVGTTNHVERLRFMAAAMANAEAVSRALSVFVVSASTCNQDTPPTDAQVQAALEAVIPRYYAVS